MPSALQTALFQAFDTLNLQRVKTFSVPPVTLCGPGAVSSCGQQAQTRGLKRGRFLYATGRSCAVLQTISGVTGAFTAAQFVYDPAGNRQ